MDDAASLLPLLADVSTTALVVVMLWFVWRRLNVITDVLLRVLDTLLERALSDNESPTNP